MSNQASDGDFAELALAVYVEELATAKRVLFVGDPGSAAAERLGRVARSLEIVSPRARARGTKRGGRVSARRWPTAEEAGRWDLVVVPDLPAAGLGDAARIEELASWLAPGGALVAGTPDPEGSAANSTALGYEEFFELLEGSFENVRMVGQAPFAGYSVVDFAAAGGDVEVTFDGSLLEGTGESPARYVALCAEGEITLDAYAVVQVPSGSSDARREAGRERRVDERRESPELNARAREQQDALDAANVHAEELEHELEELRGRLHRARADLDVATGRDIALRATSDGLRARIAEVEAELQAEVEARRREGSRGNGQGSDAEYAQLETSLWERGREITALSAEVERRATLVRDLVEELREAHGLARPMASAPVVSAPASSAPIGMSSTLQWTPEEMQRTLHAQLAQAVARATKAETARAELESRLDAMRGELAVAEGAAAQDLEELSRVEAALRGTVRGLNARLAEVIELYQQTQARLALTEDDRKSTEAKNRELVRDLAVTREQLELEIARGRMASEAREGIGRLPTIPPSIAPEDLQRLQSIERVAAQREGELLGALASCREQLADHGGFEGQARAELELARTDLSELEQRVEGLRFGYETRIAELVSELDVVGGDAERALVSVGELKTKLEVRERTDAATRGELSGMRLRLADREAAVEALTAARAAEAATPPRRRETDVSRDEASAERTDALAEELKAARAEAESLRARAEALSSELAAVPPPDDGSEAARLRASVGSRDAVIARLQAQIAHASDERERLEAKVEEHAAVLDARTEALESAGVVAGVEREEVSRELEELADRAEQNEAERRRAFQALEDARKILTALVAQIPKLEEEPLPSGADAGEIRRLRERIAHLDANAADREVLLRSLTAQLQERDDRLRALDRLDAGGGDAGSEAALRTKLLEMEERVARLSEELANERRLRSDDPS